MTNKNSNSSSSSKLSQVVLRGSPRPLISCLLAMITVSLGLYYFSQLQETLKASGFRFHSKVAILDDELIVPISEVAKGRPIILAQNDSRLLKYLGKSGVILPPSFLQYNLKEPTKDPSMGQGQYINKFFNGMRGGFFVECGALDGEVRSNTLFLEKELGWKGLLIEGDPDNYKKLLEKHRKAWTSKACLATKPYPHEVKFLKQYNLGKVVTLQEALSKGLPKNAQLVPVQCYPLFTMLSYLNVTTVDYFSLDVEGNELDVLKSIPFDSILIKSISVEFLHTSGGKMAILQFMKRIGFILAQTISHEYNLANDFIFVHPDFAHLLKV